MTDGKWTFFHDERLAYACMKKIPYIVLKQCKCIRQLSLAALLYSLFEKVHTSEFVSEH